jgi:hypothetical protein
MTKFPTQMKGRKYVKKTVNFPKTRPFKTAAMLGMTEITRKFFLSTNLVARKRRQLTKVPVRICGPLIKNGIKNDKLRMAFWWIDKEPRRMAVVSVCVAISYNHYT